MYTSTSRKTPSFEDRTSSLEKQPSSRPLIIDLDHDPHSQSDDSLDRKIPPQELIKEVRCELVDILLKLQQKAKPWLMTNG